MEMRLFTMKAVTMEFIHGSLIELSKWLGLGFAGISIFFLKKFVNDNDEKIKTIESDVKTIKETDQHRREKVHHDLAVVQTTLAIIMKKLDDSHITREKMYEKIDEISSRVFEQEKKLEVAIQQRKTA